jgi:hypothetical protein
MSRRRIIADHLTVAERAVHDRRICAPVSRSQWQIISLLARGEPTAATLQVMRPDEQVEVGAMDEHRVGLPPILRRVWVPKGQRPRIAGERTFVDIAEVERVQAERCLMLRDQQALLRAHTRFPCWPAA